MTTFNYNNPVEGDPMDAALDAAWSKLAYVPHDGGIGIVEFSQADDDDLGHRWEGTLEASTEEGALSLRVEVSRAAPIHPPDELHAGGDTTTWEMSWSRRARDCDGLYTSSGVVYFCKGHTPMQLNSGVRDHSAERAGY